VGVISSLTGLVAGGSNLGQNFANGVTLAFEQYKKTNESPVVSIDIQDDGYDSKKGVSAYHKLIDIDDVNAIINLSSPTIDAIASNVKDKIDLPVIQLGSQSNPDNDNIFEMYPNQYAAVSTLADLINKAGHKKIVVASQQIEAYAKWVDGFSKAHTGQTINEKIDPSATDFRPIA
jgi:ABC-type branched-subunit amino acid transport system substrate-binding protein